MLQEKNWFLVQGISLRSLNRLEEMVRKVYFDNGMLRSSFKPF